MNMSLKSYRSRSSSQFLSSLLKLVALVLLSMVELVTVLAVIDDLAFLLYLGGATGGMEGFFWWRLVRLPNVVELGFL